MQRDDCNDRLVTSADAVDSLNRSFYERFQFPPPPVMLSETTDRTFEVKMLNQSLGSWDHSRFPRDLKIWIAGCGRNQAFITALRFPEASIVASDLSTDSLASASATAAALGLRNIDFRQQSINSVDYTAEFDYIVCTGVIHHNADPVQPLRRISTALRKTGVLELMVYNRYHRVLTTAFQKGLRLLSRGRGFEFELELVRRIASATPFGGMMDAFLKDHVQRTEAELADTLMQPVEYSYTIDSLQDLLAGCELELSTACLNQFDKGNHRIGWDLDFKDPKVNAEYERLPDVERWKISNHLMLENSPMLWFYCRRTDSPLRRQDDRQLCAGFLDSYFRPAAIKRKLYYRAADCRYELSDRVTVYPGLHSQPDCRRIVEAVARAGPKRLRELLPELGIPESFATVNRLRLCLTTCECPYLMAAIP